MCIYSHGIIDFNVLELEQLNKDLDLISAVNVGELWLKLRKMKLTRIDRALELEEKDLFLCEGYGEEWPITALLTALRHKPSHIPPEKIDHS
jgi:hypothetical protein